MLLPVFIVFLTQAGKADQSSLLSLSSPSQVQVNWTSGPADASLGTLADIKIPQGYRLTDATGAAVLLGRMNNPIPQGLVGIIAPESGQWWAVLTYKDIGYVKGVDKGGINAAAILKTISNRADRQNEDRTIHGLPLITSVDWALAPVFDAKTHAVEWAVRARTQSAEVVNHTVRLLGRQGILDATAVAPYQDKSTAGLVPLKELVKNISFKQGQRYTDYQPGDKVSNIGLAGLIMGDEDSAASQASDAVAPGKSAGAWGWYVLAGVIAGGGVMLVRGVVQQRRHQTRRAPVTRSLVAGNAMGNGNGHAHVSAVTTVATSPVPSPESNNSQADKVETDGVKTDDVKPGVAKPEAVVAQNGLNGSANGSTHRRGARRKKIFDYHRFYTDTVMKLSSSGYTAEVTPRNGHTNGRSDGHSSAPAMEVQPASYGAMNQAIVQSHLDLIANQKALIEEQKRLVQQQTKLIEEKNKFIQEQNELLERQSAMIESQYSLKLD
ncbi:MAG TPA: DUF2167 domain-containing protein [Candidatus Sulfopaludibacter sp.]|nr:DUF2167 domain-containing protein [Candidatus Sulfopaludibacter sp.]